MIVFITAITLSIGIYLYDHYMFTWEACLRWGNTPFNAPKFRHGTTQERASMVSDLISQKYLIGWSTKKVIEKLGPRNGGYYRDEMNLTYDVNSSGRINWDLVILVNYKTQIVKKVVIYKQTGAMTDRILFEFAGLMRF